MSIPVFITARCGSTRLPRKHFLDMGGISVINHIIRRCEHFGFAPLVCVPDRDYKEFKDHIYIHNVYTGDDENVKKRILRIAELTGIYKFHHLDGDDPWFDPSIISNSFDVVADHICLHAPSISRAGAALCGTTYNLKGKLPEESIENEMPWNIKHPWPQRLTLDYPEDLHLITAVNRMVGGYMAPRWAVDELFIRNPDLHKINWFRNAEWKERQNAEKSGH